MNNLFDATVANQVKTHPGKLEPQSERLCGQRTTAQMLAHCAMSMQWAVGELVPEGAPFMRGFSRIDRIALPYVLPPPS